MPSVLNGTVTGKQPSYNTPTITILVYCCTVSTWYHMVSVVSLYTDIQCYTVLHSVTQTHRCRLHACMRTLSSQYSSTITDSLITITNIHTNTLITAQSIEHVNVRVDGINTYCKHTGGGGGGVQQL